MPSISESAEHRNIRYTKEGLRQDARSELNSGLQTTPWRVGKLIGSSPDKNQSIDTPGLLGRILSNDLTRAERRKVREMAGVGK